MGLRLQVDNDFPAAVGGSGRTASWM